MIYLVSPEHFYLFETLAVPQLAGYLKKEGTNVDSLVLDNIFYDNISKRSELEKSYKFLKNNIKNTELNEYIIKRILPFLKYSKLYNIYNLNKLNIIKSLLNKQRIITDSILNSKKELNNKFLNLGKLPFNFHLANLQLATYLFTLRWYPSTFRLFEGYKGPISKKSSKKLANDLKDRKINYFIYYYEKYILDKIKNPKHIGISFTHQSQLVPGFTLAYLIKKKCPDCHITIGGALINQIFESFKKYNPLWNYIDSVSIGQGEKTVLNLIKSVKSNKTLKGIDNIYFKNDNQIIINNIELNWDVNLVTEPIFSTKKPNPIIPLTTSFGCDWGKCKFCHFPHSSKGFSKITNYRKRDLNNITQNIKEIISKYDPSYIHLCDTNLNFSHAIDISNSLLKNDIETKLYSFIRAEPIFTTKEVCEKLKKSGFIAFHYGIESGSQKVLNSMCKGISLKTTDEVIKNFNDVGIINNVFLMTGIPGETISDYNETIKFADKHKKYIDGEFLIQRYYMDKNSEIEKYPQKFNLKKIKDEDNDLITFYDFERLDNKNNNLPDEFETYKKLRLPVSYGQRYINRFLEKYKSKKYYPLFIITILKIWIQSRATST